MYSQLDAQEFLVNITNDEVQEVDALLFPPLELLDMDVDTISS